MKRRPCPTRAGMMLEEKREYVLAATYSFTATLGLSSFASVGTRERLLNFTTAIPMKIRAMAISSRDPKCSLKNNQPRNTATTGFTNV